MKMKLGTYERQDRIRGVQEVLSTLRSLPGGADAEVQEHWEERLKMLEEEDNAERSAESYSSGEHD